ncbi:MAG: kelch repeat-containing protein, partial [bacterium]
DPGTNAWTNLNPSNPPYDSIGHSMVYDSARGKVILFGVNGVLNATWSYDPLTNAWTNCNPANLPPARLCHTMVYDSQNDKVILFGGDDNSGAGRLNDTWAYDPGANSWANLNPANPPPARRGHDMVYDTVLGNVILFGGVGDNGFNDTWTYDYDTNAWTNRNPCSPPPVRTDSPMAYDSQSGKVILFGGWGRFGHVNDTWTYDYGEDPPTLSLLSPNGGESWETGSTQTIAWTSQWVSGNVKIEINRSYPSGTWDTLFASVPNDGSESWVVTAPASATCRIRISSVSDPAIQDISDGNFAIVGPPAPLAINSILATPNSGVSNWNPVTIQASANRSGSWSGTIHHPSGTQIGTLAGGSGSAYTASWAPSAAQNFCGNGFYAVVQVTSDGEMKTASVSFAVENFPVKTLPVNLVNDAFQSIANPLAGQAFYVVVSIINNSASALSSSFTLVTVNGRYIGAGGYQNLQPGQQSPSYVHCEGLVAGNYPGRVYVWISLGGYALAQPLDFPLTVLP